MRTDQDVSLAIQGRLFAALLEHWHLTRPDVVAHDFGGCTALRGYLLHGCEYRSLTLIDPVALAPWGSPFVRHVREHEAAFAGLPPYIHAAIVPAYIAGAAFRSLSAQALQLYVDPWLSESGQAAFYRQIAQMDQRYTDEIESRYSEIRCPVMILWGRRTAGSRSHAGRELASRIPGATCTACPMQAISYRKMRRKRSSPRCWAFSASRDNPIRSPAQLASHCGGSQSRQLPG